MYTVTVLERFTAEHRLTVPDPGPEGERHAHAYEAEVGLRGPALDVHGYLVDIDEARAVLDGAVERYEGTMLNELPEFEGENPSAERLARAIWERVTDGLDTAGLESVSVTVWEDETAAVSYEDAV